MTLTNICLLAICVCAVWMLEQSAQADPLTPLPADGAAAEPAYVRSITETLVNTAVTTDGSGLAGDLGQGFDTDEYVPFTPVESQEKNGFRSAVSRGMSGLMSPFAPSGEMWSAPVGDGTFTGQVGARGPFLNSCYAANSAGFVQSAGPLALDIYSITFTGLYSDFSQRSARAADDDGFLAALSLRGALTLDLGESFHLGLGFTVYYLPTVNRVGLYFGNGGLGTEASMWYKTDIGRWHVTVGDEFRVFHPVGDLLRDYEVDEIATVSHYRFGRPDSLQDRAFFSEDIYFLNIARISATRDIAENWKFTLYADRGDVWHGTSLTKVGDDNRVGAEVAYASPETGLKAWLDYTYYDRLHAHMVVAGTAMPLTPTFTAYARAGLISYDYQGRSGLDHYLWELGFVHHLNEEISESLFLGYTYAFTDYGDDFLGTYGRYTITWHPDGTRWRFSASVQEDENTLTDARGLYYGARAVWSMTERTSLSFLGSTARYRRDGGVSKRWITGASLSHVFTPTLSGELSYQYSEYTAPNPDADFNEHLFILSLTKSF